MGNTVFKVLLIDDEPGALEGMQLWIDWAKLGYEVCGSCENGVEGLKLMEQLRPELVITDVRMPLMDGLELIEAWRQRGGWPVRFAIVSGYSEFQYAQKALRFGVSHYFLKPIDEESVSEELRGIYKELLGEQERQRIHRIASYEEAVTAIESLLYPQYASAEKQRVIDRLSELCEAWNVCLIQADAQRRMELKERLLFAPHDPRASYWIDLDNTGSALVFGYAPNEDGPDGIGRIQRLASVAGSSREFIGLGRGTPSLRGIEASYRETKELLQLQFYEYVHTGIKRRSAVQLRAFNYRYDQVSQADRIITALQLLDKSGFEEAVWAAARHFRDEWVAPEIVIHFVAHLFFQISELVKEMPDAAERLLEKYNPSRIPGQAVMMDDLIDQLRAFGFECIDLLLEENMRVSQGIIHDINQYIRAHYREGLTIKKLAEIFYLHPVYLGQLLMKKNGVGFNEWVHNLRIEEATRLLRLNQYKNSEIAEQVGYVNYSQFLKQFEKRLGMSPNEYKNRN